MDLHNMEDAAVREWISSSYFLYISVISVSILTLPLLILSLVSLFKHRKSHYFVCLSSIITGNIVLLGTICLTVLLENHKIFSDVVQGSAMCKTNAFLVNVSSCFVHWTWVVMYLQRCVCVFFPMRARRNRKLVNGWCAIFGVFVFSIITQSWTPVVMTELTVQSEGGNGSYCGEDSSLAGSHLLQAVAIVECVLTFFVPFVLTVLTDISVVVLRRPCRPQFILIPADAIAGCDPPSHDGSYLKIVSRKNIDFTERRRHSTIRRCLLMATVNLFLNLPNYTLQVCDQFLHLGNSSNLQDILFFLRADAAAYVLYLLQFPLVPMYIYLLKGDLDKSLDRKAIRRRMGTSCRSQDPSL